MKSRRIERVFRYARERREEREAGLPPYDEEIDGKLDKKDMLAMILSAFGIILPVALAVLFVMIGIGYFFIFR